MVKLPDTLNLGANTVLITSHQTKYFPRPEFIISQGKAQAELDAHAMEGNAYQCSAAALSQLAKRKNTISDVRSVDE